MGLFNWLVVNSNKIREGVGINVWTEDFFEVF